MCPTRHRRPSPSAPARRPYVRDYAIADSGRRPGVERHPRTWFSLITAPGEKGTRGAGRRVAERAPSVRRNGTCAVRPLPGAVGSATRLASPGIRRVGGRARIGAALRRPRDRHRPARHPPERAGSRGARSDARHSRLRGRSTRRGPHRPSPPTDGAGPRPFFPTVPRPTAHPRDDRGCRGCRGGCNPRRQSRGSRCAPGGARYPAAVRRRLTGRRGTPDSCSCSYSDSVGLGPPGEVRVPDFDGSTCSSGKPRHGRLRCGKPEGRSSTGCCSALPVGRVSATSTRRLRTKPAQQSAVRWRKRPSRTGQPSRC